MATICTILTTAAQHDWEIHQVDIKSAYLNAELRDDIYMRAPAGYLKKGDEGKVLKLLRSLYGLKQAGYEWSEELKKFFTDSGFNQSQVDQGVYFRCTDQEHTVIMVSVDDMAITSAHLSDIVAFKAQLQTCFEITDLGELKWLLGLKVERDRAKRTIVLSQEAYVNTVLERFNMESANPAATPMDTGAALNATPEDQVTQADDMRAVPYARAIGSLMYAATSTCPDISFAVSILSQFMRDPARDHWEAVKRAIRYLKGTKQMKLTLGASDDGLEVYADADMASQPHRHSMSGCLVLFMGHP